MLFEKAYTESENLSSIGPSASSLAEGSHATTYVMCGPTAQRRVTTYHLILAPTHACNLRCEHCYLPDHAAQTLPKAVALRLLREWDEIAADETPGRRGIFHIKGGEPLIYKPLLSILQEMQALPHLHFMMTTNGTLFEDRHWSALDALNTKSGGPVTVIVSLDGASAKTHELLRGIGSFELTMRTLCGLQQRGIRTYINSVLHAENIHEIDAVVDLALNLGVAQLNFLPFVPKGFGQSMRQRQLPHLEAFDKIREIYLGLPEDRRQLLAGSLPDIVNGEKQGVFTAAHECVAAYRGLLYIKPDGHAFTCPNLEAREHSVGSVHLASLRTILDNLNELYLRLHSDEASDRYICMGERKLYESVKDTERERSLLHSQDILASASKGVGADVSFCVSRNW